VPPLTAPYGFQKINQKPLQSLTTSIQLGIGHTQT